MRNFEHPVPGFFGLLLQILSGAVFGLMIAVVYLVLKPVHLPDAKAAAKDDKKGASVNRNVVEYRPGNPGNPSGQQWRLRERAFLERMPAGVALGEQDLNRWVASTYGSAERTFKLESYGLEVTAELPLFRLDGTAMQVGLEYSIKLGEFEKKIIAQTRGSLEKADGQHGFQPASVHLGSCPLPGRAGEWLVAKLSAAYPVPENVAASWKAVTSAKLEQSQLRLSF